MAAQLNFFFQDILGGQLLRSQVELVSTTTQDLQKLAGSPGSIYYACAPKVIPQCSIDPCPWGGRKESTLLPTKKHYVLPNKCSGKPNKLNIEACQSEKYPITCNLFVVVKQTAQIEQQASVADANLLSTEQEQEMITQAGFVKIR